MRETARYERYVHRVASLRREAQTPKEHWMVSLGSTLSQSEASQLMDPSKQKVVYAPDKAEMVLIWFFKNRQVLVNLACTEELKVDGRRLISYWERKLKPSHAQRALPKEMEFKLKKRAKHRADEAAQLSLPTESSENTTQVA